MADFQKSLVNYILKEETPEGFLDTLIPGGKLNSESALKVYRNDYVARLTSVLGENYEGTWAVLGDDFFFKLCRDFIDKNNSNSFDIGEYGNDFHLFLKGHPLGLEYPFLSDLAYLESNFMRVFHSPLQRPIVGFSKDQNIFEMKFKFIQGMHFQKSIYPIFKIWELRNLPCENRKEISLDFNEGCNLVLFKNNSGIRTSFFKETQIDILENLYFGKTLSDSLPENISPQEVEEIFKFISSSGILLSVD